MDLPSRTLFIGALLLLSACSNLNTKELVGGLVGGAADTKVGYKASQCKHIRMQCTGGKYQEWETSDGTPGCACKINTK